MKLTDLNPLLLNFHRSITMKTIRNKKWILFSIIAALITLSGCQAEKEKGYNSQREASKEKQKRTVTIVPKFSALFSERITEKSRSINSSTESYFSGTLSITMTDQANQPVEGSPFSVTVLLDETNKTARFNQTLTLPTGTYKSIIDLQGNDGHRYMGESVFVIQDGQNSTINLSIHPVIGSNNLQISSITELNRVRFQYPVSQVSQFAYPQLGISINDAQRVIYSINQQDSTGDEYLHTSAYLDLELGSNKIELAFFDGSTQVGKSHPDQELKDILPGEDIRMDIVPMEGSLAFNLPVNGESATVAIQLPNAINDVSTDQISVRVSMIQDGAVKSQAQGDVTGSYGSYQANLTLPELFHGEYTLLTELFESTTQNKLSECNAAVTLGSANQSLSCDFHIYHGEVTASGDLLSSVHVTVQDENGTPLNGATIQLNNIMKTTSGGGDSSDDLSGYGHFYQQPGSYTIAVQLGDQRVTRQITLEPLRTKNLFFRIVRIENMENQRLALGNRHVCFLKENGKVMCWGDNRWKQIGNGIDGGVFLTPQEVVGIDNAISISTRANTTCALLQDKTVKCWGKGSSGTLGHGIYADSNTPVTVTGLSNVKSIEAGTAHICTILEDQSVQCWGDNIYGAFGFAPVRISYNTPQPIPGLSGVKSLSANNWNGCALLNSDSISCWGYKTIPPDESGDTNSNMYQYEPIAIPSMQGVKQIVMGITDSNFLLFNDGRVMAWGNGNSNIPRSEETTYQSTPSLTLSTLQGAKYLASGSNHACALLENQSVQCWGNNANGKLGIGTFEGSNTTPQQVLELSNVLELQSTVDRNCVWLGNDEVKCWGHAGGYGGLGDGSYYIDTENTGDKAIPVRVKGL